MSVQPGTQKWKVLEAVRRAGASGITRDGIAAELEEADSAVDARVGELMRDDLVAETRRTRQTRYGRMARLLVISDLAPPEPECLPGLRWEETSDG